MGLKDRVRLAVFDMDGVLIDSRSSWVLVHNHFGTENEDSLQAFLRGEIDDMEFIRRDVERWEAVRGRVSWDEVKGVLDTAPVFPGAIETLRQLGKRGIRTAIVSGGLRYLAEHIGRKGDVDFVRANAVVVDDDGRLTGEGIVQVPLMEKGGVVEEIQEDMGIGPDQTAAVGDSRVDVRARVSIAFNPRDAITERTALHTVRSRDLLSVLPLLFEESG
jgi:phosphoserine phosphatase